MADFNINPEALIKIPGQVWVFWKDKKSHFLGCNDNMAEELNLASRHDIYGKNDYDLLTDKIQIEHVVSCDKAVMLSGITQQSKDIITLPNQRKEFNCTKFPLINSNGKTIGVIGISFCKKQNITKSFYDTYITIKEAKLTNREEEILNYIIRGKTAKVIAQLTHLSYRTIEQHIGNIKTKLNVRTKSELIEKTIDYFF